IRESEAEQNFKSVLSGLLTDTIMQQRLSENIKKLAKPNATKDIVAEIEKLLNS
ncbi:MAG: UDP-N-acetylglucosamine--N-acetylmuramyl-(pentapeptide) pyrophosphoryl-undecaprenol N-acetylglucosamine transferase, partial [Bacteroidetes bacterium]